MSELLDHKAVLQHFDPEVKSPPHVVGSNMLAVGDLYSIFQFFSFFALGMGETVIMMLPRTGNQNWALFRPTNRFARVSASIVPTLSWLMQISGRASKSLLDCFFVLAGSPWLH